MSQDGEDLVFPTIWKLLILSSRPPQSVEHQRSHSAIALPSDLPPSYFETVNSKQSDTPPPPNLIYLHAMYKCDFSYLVILQMN